MTVRKELGRFDNELGYATHSPITPLIPSSFSDDASITSLTVQIFTVKSIAHKLLEEENAFAIMARYYKEHMKTRVFDSEGT